MNVFPCTACGACCRRPEALSPYWPKRADGACAHLNADNTCAIYETRPEVCRSTRPPPPGLTREEWWRRVIESCNQSQVFYGIPESFRIPTHDARDPNDPILVVSPDRWRGWLK